MMGYRAMVVSNHLSIPADLHARLHTASGPHRAALCRIPKSMSKGVPQLLHVHYSFKLRIVGATLYALPPRTCSVEP